MALRDESHQDSSTKNVLDYYKKYTQNSNLSKYFSGADQCSPNINIPIKENDQNRVLNTIKFTSATETPITTYSFGKLSSSSKGINNILDSSKPGKISSNKNTLNIRSHSPPALVSPSDNPKIEWDDRDSPLDDKKLEWDSGADIGYHIAQSNEEKKPLRKCVSLPVLHNLKAIELNIYPPDLTSTLVQNEPKVFIDSLTPDSTSRGTSLNKDLSENSTTASGVTSNYVKQAFSSSTASNSSCRISKAKLSSGCSSNSEDESKLLDFKMTLSYLKDKVGLPAAHSTPNIQSSLQHNDIDLEKIMTSKSLVKKKDVNKPKTSQPLLPKNETEIESVSFGNIEGNIQQNDNISKQATKMQNKRVIELSISKPISIDWISSQIIDKNKLVEEYVIQDKNKSKLNPKVDQVENIFQLELKANKKPPKENQHISTFSFEHIAENKNDSKAYSNYSSNCNSFEYIGNVTDNKVSNSVSKENQGLQGSKGSKHKMTTPSSNSTRDSSTKSESKSISGSVSGDIEKHLDLLQKLLNSKKVHPSKKQFYIRKLTKDISGFKDVDSNGSSGLFCLKGDKHKNDCSIPSKLQSIKSSSPHTVGKCVLSSSNGSSSDVKKNNKHSKYVADRRRDSDYLVQFAENERDYQINWIDNEISHLTKLKSVLEVKNCKDFNKRKTNQTSVYKITQNDGINKNSERDYVIQTKLDIDTSKKIQYCLQGKKYSISDCNIPNTWRNLNDNSANADIKIHAEERQTNIKVSTSCCICNQEPCVCESEIRIDCIAKSNSYKQYDRSKCHTREPGSQICPDCQELKCNCQKAERKTDWIKNNADKQYDRSKFDTGEPGPQIYPVCQELKCIYQKAESNTDWTKSDTDHQYDRSEFHSKWNMEHCNSSNGSSNLTEKCVKESDHQQDFTGQTEFREYDLPSDLPQHFNSLQKIFQKCCCTVENRVCNCLFVRNLFNRLLPNDNIRIPKDVLLPSPKDLKTNVATTDNECQTSPLNGNKERVNEVQKSGCRCIPCNLQLSCNPSLGINNTTQTTTPLSKTTCADFNHKKISLLINGEKENTNIEVECDRCTGIFMTQNITNNKGPTCKADIDVCATPRANINYTNIGIQTSVDWVKNLKNKNIECITRTGSTNCNCNKQQSGTTRTEGFTETKELSTDSDKQQRRTTKAEGVTETNELSTDSNKQQSGTTKTEGVTETKELSTDSNKQETGTTKTKGVAETKELSTDSNKQQSGTTKTEGVTETKELSTDSDKQQSRITKTEGVTETKELSTDFDKQQRRTTKTVGVTETNELSTDSNKQQSGNTKRAVVTVTKDFSTDSNKQETGTTKTKGVAETKELSTDSNKQQSGTTKTEGVTKTKELSTDSNKQQSGITTTEVVTRTKENNVNRTKIDIGIRECCLDLLKRIAHDKKQARSGSEEFFSRTDALNKYVSSQTSDEQKQDSDIGSGHLKEVTTQTSTQKKTKAEATSDETFACCSCGGCKSSSISTSVFDSVSYPPEKSKCRKKRVFGEVTTVQKAVCSRCDNKHIYTVNNVQHQHKCLNYRWHGHCNHCNVNCCTRKCEKCPVMSQGVAYNLIIQEPINNRSEKHVTSGNGDYFYRNKHKNSKDNGHKNKHANPSKDDKYQIKNNYNGSQLELLKESQPQHTIRDYLMINRPKFIYSAENRRQSVLNSRIFREHQKNSLKLQFLENNLNRFADEGAYKLFTEREMKDITKKNYKKLPEIQKKISDLRDKRLRGADKLICDLFEKKVQKSALKGQWNFPIDKTITNWQQ